MTDAERRQRIDELCDAALDRRIEERAAFIATACKDDHALRREVESLLAHAPMVDEFLATTATAVAAEMFVNDHESLVGQQLGPYNVVAFIGAGGMGEVYRARDARLGRDVAIKVLPDPFVSIPGRLARFELEARVLATLNHPHIAAIYGIEEAGDVRGLVLELVDGPTLGEHLAAGPLSINEALELARQLADALESAHEKGIIHRDLKPANIKITPNGTIKVLDFGLAKVFATEDSPDEAANLSPAAPTHSHDGDIAGTMAYMSPEQSRGRPVDKRTDIWAFGCVLYQMLTGRPAFAGDTSPETVAAVRQHEPDWALLPAQTPANIMRLIRRCLEKDPKRRLRDIGDARLEIEETLNHPDSNSPVATARRAHVGWWVAAAAGLPIVIVAATMWALDRSDYFWRNPLEGAKPIQLTEFGGAEQHAAISRDGKFIAFLSDRGGAWDVWVSQVGTGRSHNLTEGSVLTKGSIRELRNPATRTLGFSPDGSLVALWTRSPGGSVDAGWSVPTMGGTPQPYLTGISELDWSSDGTRIVYHPPAEGDPLFVTRANEKVGSQIYVARAGFHNHFPVWSRDDAYIYFVHGLPLDESDLWRIPAAGGEPERLTFHAARVSFPTFLNRRTLLYLTTDHDGSGPWIYALDVKRKISRRIVTGLEQYTSLSASDDGERLVATASRSTSRLWRAARTDRAVDESQSTLISLPTGGGVSPRIGPDYIVYRTPKAGRDGLWRIATDGAATELWNGINGRAVAGPAISPDGRRIAFTVQAGERTQLYVMNSDGTGTRRIAEQLDVRGAPAWSPDGRTMAIAANENGEPHLFKISVDGGTPVPLVKDYSTDPTWSPNGEFLVYSGADVGTTFSVKAVTSGGAPRPLPKLVLSRGARRLVFLTNGTLVFMKGDLSHKDLWSIDLETGREQPLTSLGSGFVMGDFDISRDGGAIVFDRTREESDIVLFDLQTK
jgi:Tol biopolymer transport system component